VSVITAPRRLIRIAELSKAREGNPVLDRLGLEISAGKSCGIIAEDRDALATLIDIVSGAEAEDSGFMAFDVHAGAGAHAGMKERLARVGVARERPRLVEKMSVLDNIYLGSIRKYRRFGLIDESLMRRKAEAYLRLLDARVLLDEPLHSLDRAARVLVDIARVLAKDCDLMVFDSVTRAMSAWQYEAFATALRSLKAKGPAILIMPVNAEDVRTLIDSLYVLVDGQLKEIEHPSSLGDDELNALFLHGDKRGLNHISDPIYKARVLIDDLVGQGDIDFKDLASSVFMSYDNFRRKFKLQVGLSPNQYFIKLKVDRAKELLQYTDLEIKEIAERIGLSDPYYFSRLFKGWEGRSPLSYRGKKGA
jgi:ABC-type sugar transport system ATPase subunit